jgi:hypothetical protein
LGIKFGNIVAGWYLFDNNQVGVGIGLFVWGLDFA